MNADILAFSGNEYQVTFSVKDNGADLGIFKFYHPMGEEVPISAISLLNRNVGIQLEQAIKRILSQEDSALVSNPSEYPNATKSNLKA
jgi:hypothetical protein